MSTCKSCRADVVFVKSARSGRSQIIDAKPTKGIVLQGPLNGVIAARQDVLGPRGEEYLDQCKARVVDVWTDHHVTCPAAAEWKGKTRATARA